MPERNGNGKGRGFYGIGAVLPKNTLNIGGLFRSAQAFDAAFIFTVNRRYKRESVDTTNTPRHVPLYHYGSWDDFWDHIPYDCVPIAVEVHGAIPLPDLIHPRSALYILGPEDGSIPGHVMARCPISVSIPTRWCLNVATAGSIVMYDRAAKAGAHA